MLTDVHFMHLMETQSLSQWPRCLRLNSLSLFECWCRRFEYKRHECLCVFILLVLPCVYEKEEAWRRADPHPRSTTGYV
jgi:hypothetical protein